MERPRHPLPAAFPHVGTPRSLPDSGNIRIPRNFIESLRLPRALADCTIHPPCGYPAWQKPTAVKTSIFAPIVIAAALPAASAALIYQDDFSGTSATALQGSVPDTRVAGEGGSATATWTAQASILFNGSNGASLVSEANASRAAYLPFTPQANFLYDYQISMAFAEVNSASRSMQMGFFGSANPGMTTALTSSNTQGPVIFFRNAGTYVARGAGGTDITGFNGSVPGAAVTAIHTFRITLDTSQAQWVMRTYFDGVEFGGGHTFSTNPTIGAVGFSVNASNSLNAAGTFSNLSLTATAIPEPTAQAILALCLMMPVMRRVRRSA